MSDPQNARERYEAAIAEMERVGRRFAAMLEQSEAAAHELRAAAHDPTNTTGLIPQAVFERHMAVREHELEVHQEQLEALREFVAAVRAMFG